MNLRDTDLFVNEYKLNNGLYYGFGISKHWKTNMKEKWLAFWNNDHFDVWLIAVIGWRNESSGEAIIPLSG